jgi:rhamnosyltransferase subunit B
MNVVVTTFGSDGDVNPMLAVAAALVRRGVSVSFVANPFYRLRVEQTGSRFVAAGTYFDVFAALADKPEYFDALRGGVAIWNDLAVPCIRDCYPVVRDTVRSVAAATVVSHVISAAGAWAAAETGVRSVLLTTTTAAWLSRHQPLVFGNWRAPWPLQAWLTVALRGIGGPLMRRALGRLAGELGAPQVPDPVRVADLNVGVWPDWFRPLQADDPPRTQLSGFVYGEGRAAAVAPQVAEFLRAGAAPVVVGFGSAARLHAADRYRTVAEVCRRLRRRCLLVGAPAGVFTASPDLLAVAAAPYAAVFPAACAIVHHGGFGTAGEALRAGRPSLVTPFAFDQFDVAARVEAAGAGRWLRASAGDTDAMTAALAAVLNDGAMAASASRAAAHIGAAPDGADRAAELVTDLVRRAG